MKLENELISVEITLKGAEVLSMLNKKTNQEMVWNGNADYWTGHNPILFPIIGSTFDKKIHIEDKIYVMGNHGFTRSSMFKLVDETAERITLRLSDSAETLAQYPYEFDLDVVYSLCVDTLLINYRITNKSIKSMPFSFGLHPAFNVPMDTQKKYEDYYLNFPCIESELPQSTLIGENPQRILLSESFFESMPTLVLEYPASPYVELTDGIHGVRVSTMGYRWLAFWKKANAPYLCIEPWHGHGDLEEVDTDFTKREGTLILDPKHSYTTSYSIQLF